MITPEQANITDNTTDIDHAKIRLENYIDHQLRSIEMKNEMIEFSLAGRLDIYRSSAIGQVPTYNFYEAVLLPIVEKYKSVGWFVYCRTFFSFIQRDNLYFSKKEQTLTKGFILEWEGTSPHMKPVRAIENKSDFFIPEFQTQEEANRMIKAY